MTGWLGSDISSEVYDQLLVGLTSVRERDINGLMPLVYSAAGRGLISDAQSDSLLTAAQVRHNTFAARRRMAATPKAPVPHLFMTDRRTKARRRRRVWAGSAALPHNLRSSFTHGENAAAAVIAAEVRKHGQCALAWSSIAKAAGLLSPTVVKRFVRQARRMGLIRVEERRVKGGRNLPSIITIVSAAWMAWIKCETASGEAVGWGHGRTSLQNTRGKNLSLLSNRAPIERSQWAYEDGRAPPRKARTG